nr:TPA_asm: ND3 [Echinogammarus veneris]
MLTMTLMVGFALIVSMILPMISYVAAKNSLTQREKTTPFECGFDPNKKARSPFSIRFFLVAILFLIFDVEIVLLLPLVLLIIYSQPVYLLILSFLMVLILVLGLIHEWNQGALTWVI